LRNEDSIRPHYGYYALPIFTILSAISFAVGIVVLASLCWFAGLVLVGLGLYTIFSYGISMLLTNQRMASELPAIIEIRGDEKVLDVGCGLGKMTIGIAKVLTEGKVIGIDIWNKMEIPGNSPERAYENAEIEGVAHKVEFKYGNVMGIPFTDDSFDLVTAQSVLNNLHGALDKSKALVEIRRVLQPRGKLLMLELLRNLRGFLTFTPFAFWALLSKEKWMKLLKEAEFINIRYTYENGLGIFLAEKPNV
jgi:ubiquinone/menaquinone biosynthesis C-methylase UbiE